MQIPDTSFYMTLGYSIIFSMIGGYLISLFLRYQRAKRTLRMQEDLKDHPEMD